MPDNNECWIFEVLLPRTNAALNALAATLLVVGLVLIKQRRINAHRNCMISTFAISALFLVLYLLHKFWKAATGRDMHTSFNREGLAKTLYLAILFTHLTLALSVPVLATWLIRLGLKRRDRTHRRLAKVAFPIWMYVSITGVLIYFMLYHWNPPETIE